MNYLLLGFVCAVIGVAPLLAMRKVKTATICASVATLVLWGLFYAGMPELVYPLFGSAGFMVFVMWIISACTYSVIEDLASVKVSAIFVVAAAIMYMGSFAGSLYAFRSGDYVRMIGPVEKRVWTQDVQPKDPRHIRMGSLENAEYMANKALGEAGAIGSQFQVSKTLIRLQKIKDEFWYVVPLDFAGFSQWSNAERVPGYIMVHAEDPKRQAVMSILPEEKMFVYTPEAYFGTNLERHIRRNGYFGSGLTDYCLEIDDEGKAWWVVKTFEPTIVWGGNKITGLLIVDPVSGEITPISLDKIPEWIDRVIPVGYVRDYLTWWGEFQKGWWNTFWGTDRLTKPEDPDLIYNAEHSADWVVGMTSTGAEDDSLVSVMYVNSRTGKAVQYETKGGGTDEAVLAAVNKNEQVQFKKLHGAGPQLYNIHGTMASVVPLLNENHAFQGVAIVSINNVQQVAVGRDQYEAVRVYQRMLTMVGGRIALSNARELKIAEGFIDRFYDEISGSGITYGLHINGIPHLFVGGAQELSAPELPATKIGDKVKVGYYAANESVVPMSSFENLSLDLIKSPEQMDVEQRGLEQRDGENAKAEANTTMEAIKAMTPEQIREIGKTLPKQNQK